MQIDKTLKLLIKRRGITTAELAGAINTPAKTISDWLSGGRTPRDLDAVKRCAEYFNTSIHFLLFGEDDPKGSIAAFLEKTEIHTGLYEISIRKVTERKS